MFFLMHERSLISLIAHLEARFVEWQFNLIQVFIFSIFLEIEMFTLSHYYCMHVICMIYIKLFIFILLFIL